MRLQPAPLFSHECLGRGHQKLFRRHESGPSTNLALTDEAVRSGVGNASYRLPASRLPCLRFRGRETDALPRLPAREAAGLELAARQRPALVNPAGAGGTRSAHELGADEPAGRVTARRELLDELSRLLPAPLPQRDGHGARPTDAKDLLRRDRDVPVPLPGRCATGTARPTIELGRERDHGVRAQISARHNDGNRTVIRFRPPPASSAGSGGSVSRLGCQAYPSTRASHDTESERWTRHFPENARGSGRPARPMR